jgi:phosphoribosylglycinamide formyltransferase-1
MSARLGILLSGSGTTYANLARQIADGLIPAEIALVVSSRPGVKGLDLAAAHGHPACVAAEPEAVTAALRQAGATHVAMCGWMRFWDPPADWQDRTVNVHPSLLPAFGGRGMYGRRVHTAVLAAGCKVAGCTVHLVSGEYDSGPILAQQTVPVLPEDDVAALEARVQAAERALYPRVVAALVSGGIVARDGRYHIPALLPDAS